MMNIGTFFGFFVVVFLSFLKNFSEGKKLTDSVKLDFPNKNNRMESRVEQNHFISVVCS